MLVDAYKRPIRDLRISVTDRCNFRCTYCMPLDEYEWIDKKEILTFEEITRLARLFVQFGVEKIRLTGGEPLVRQDLAVLVKKLSALGGLEDLCLTTNGALLAEKIESLLQAGLRRVNISIDTLDANKFKRMTKRGDLNKVLEGIFAAKKVGLAPIKLNAVIERGVNDDDILPLVEFSREHGFALRFIEYVDGQGDIGVIASVTEPFCSRCTRIRLTADGKIVTCLFSQVGHDIKSRLRGGASDEEISEFIGITWRGRTDRYSAEQLEALKASNYDPKSHKKIEMISLGG